MPPVSQILTVIRNLRNCATLIVSFWPSVPFWPVRVPQPGGVTHCITLPLLVYPFISGPGQQSACTKKTSIFDGKQSFPVLTLGISFRWPDDGALVSVVFVYLRQ